MENPNQRRHARVAHQAKIRVVLPVSSQIMLHDMRDFSESGLFLFCKGETLAKVGDVVDVQTTEFEDAPLQSARVVRIDPGIGYALAFIGDESNDQV